MHVNTAGGGKDTPCTSTLSTLHVHTSGGGKGYTLHCYTWLLLLLYLLYEIEKSEVNAGKPEY